VQLGLKIQHHDHGYLERRGGHAFFGYLRGAPARGHYRRNAIQRAVELHARAVASDGSPEEVCGAGLIVMQRVAFATEDLGGLLHGLANDVPAVAGNPNAKPNTEIWTRLTGVRVPDHRAVFEGVLRDPTSALRAFRLPTADDLAAEEPDPEIRVASVRLRDLTAERWTRMLTVVARFWLQYGDFAKATMHGMPAIASRQLTESPGAGSLARDVAIPERTFTLMVNSTVSGSVVHTRKTPLILDSERVGYFQRAGNQATKATRELCEMLAKSIEDGYAFGIPPRLAHLLTNAERDAVGMPYEPEPDRPSGAVSDESLA